MTLPLKVLAIHLSVRIFAFVAPVPLIAQEGGIPEPDSLCVKAGVLVILKDSLYITGNDTVIPRDERFVRLRNDPYVRTASFYEALLKRVGDSGIRKELHRLFIRDNNPTAVARKNEIRREDYFKPFEGKVIRSIRATRVPMLDGNVNDTSGTSLDGWNRFINLHPQTPSWVARGKGVIREGQRVLPGALADHERLIRELPNIRDAKLYVSPVDGSDSVDIVVVTQDLFPLRLNIDYRNSDELKVRVNDRNITGTGLETDLEYNSFSSLENGPEWAIRLNQYNLFNRFFDASAGMRWNDSIAESAFSFNRDFRSGALSHIGGVEWVDASRRKSSDTEATQQGDVTDSRRLGLWYGHVFSNASLEWSFIPAFSRNESFQNIGGDWKTGDRTSLYSFTIIRRSYLRSALVRKYGTSEYIPVGFSMNYTAGPVNDGFGKSWYSGAAVEWARYFEDVGYWALSWNGSYYSGVAERSDRLSNYGLDYYTPLLRIGRARCRQFVELRYNSISQPERASLFETTGPWSTANGSVPTGSNLWHGAIRSVFFMPWYVYGFRFSIYGGAEVYRLGNPLQNSASEVAYYPIFQAGLRMQNDFLTYGDYSFQISYAPPTNIDPAYFSLSFRTFFLPLFDGLRVGKPTVGSLPD